MFCKQGSVLEQSIEGFQYRTWYGVSEPGERIIRVAVVTVTRVGLSGHGLVRGEVEPRNFLALEISCYVKLYYFPIIEVKQNI